LGAGSSLEAQYALKGPRPAGHYSVLVKAITNAPDANVRADVIWRQPGQPDQVLGTLTGTSPGASDHAVPYVDDGFDGPAIAAKAGDVLVLKVTHIAGTRQLIAVFTSMTIP
jgi:hypothetical protein